MLYLLTTIGLPPGGSSTVHFYTQTIHGTIQLKIIPRLLADPQCSAQPCLGNTALDFRL